MQKSLQNILPKIPTNLSPLSSCFLPEQEEKNSQNDNLLTKCRRPVEERQLLLSLPFVLKCAISFPSRVSNQKILDIKKIRPKNSTKNYRNIKKSRKKYQKPQTIWDNILHKMFTNISPLKSQAFQVSPISRKTTLS